jgi:hypothetical protein
VQQNVFAKANQPPPPAADIRRVRLFKEEHKNGLELDSVQIDWPLPFSSPWNATAIHVLAEGFWLLHRDNELELTVNQIKVLCISKLERTHKEFNDLRSSDQMDTEEGAEEEHTIRKC